MRRGTRIHRGFLLVAILLASSAASPNAASAAPTRTEIDSVPGTILDVLPDRILFRERTPETDTLKVKDRLTDEITTLPSVSPIERGFLTSHGAMFVATIDTSPYAKLYESRDGALLDLGGANSNGSLRVKGDYDECTAPNRTHGPPLDSPSCNPPSRTSDHLTVGTADSNGQVVRYEGHVRLNTIVGNPAPPADEADVAIDFFSKGALTNGLANYTGELRAEVPQRMAERWRGKPAGTLACHGRGGRRHARGGLDFARY